MWIGAAGHAVYNGLLVLLVNAAGAAGDASAESIPWGWVLGSLVVFLAGALALAATTRGRGPAGPSPGTAGAPGAEAGSVTMGSPEGGDSEVSR